MPSRVLRFGEDQRWSDDAAWRDGPDQNVIRHNDAIADFNNSVQSVALAHTYVGNTSVLNASRRLESAFLQMVNGLELYCKVYRRSHDMPIGQDAYLGEQLESMLHSLQQMLSGDIGRLDGGIMSTRLRTIATDHSLDFPR